MTPVELSRTVLRAVRRAVDEGELDVAAPLPERVVVAPPGPGGCGDYATNVALQLARPAGQPPRRVAEILRPHLLRTGGIADVVVTGPGFLNISLGSTAPVALVREILRSGPRYGHGDSLAGQVVRLHAPHEVRAVVHLDALARILRSQGALVRTSCAGPLEPDWATVLGVRTVDDDTGASESGRVAVRPVPAPADPLPLGRDAARWALLRPAPHDRPRICDDHLVQREGNPLFRVRYAHARTRALLRNAADLGFGPEPGAMPPALPSTRTPEPGPAAPVTASTPGPEPRSVPLATTPEPTDLPAVGPATAAVTAPNDGFAAPGVQPLPAPDVQPLLQALADHPRVLAAAAAHRAPDRLARHLVTVADATLPLLPAVLPLGEEKPSAAHRARLALADAAGAVLAGGLSLLGIDAPDHL